VTRADLLKAVLARMDADGVSQRKLAARIGTSQGHLSKVLRGRIPGPSRVVRELERYVQSDLTVRASGVTDAASAEAALIRAARNASGGDIKVMHHLIELMHLVGRLRS
jgi:transcriptional regulator with XRE-family HTH domain